MKIGYIGINKACLWDLIFLSLEKYFLEQNYTFKNLFFVVKCFNIVQLFYTIVYKY